MPENLGFGKKRKTKKEKKIGEFRFSSRIGRRTFRARNERSAKRIFPSRADWTAAPSPNKKFIVRRSTTSFGVSSNRKGNFLLTFFSFRFQADRRRTRKRPDERKLHFHRRIQFTLSFLCRRSNRQRSRDRSARRKKENHSIFRAVSFFSNRNFSFQNSSAAATDLGRRRKRKVNEKTKRKRFSFFFQRSKEIFFCRPTSTASFKFSTFDWNKISSAKSSSDQRFSFFLSFRWRFYNTKRGLIRKVRFAPGKGNFRAFLLFNDGLDIWDIRDVRFPSNFLDETFSRQCFQRDRISSLKFARETIQTSDAEWPSPDRIVVACSDHCLRIYETNLIHTISSMDFHSFPRKENRRRIDSTRFSLLVQNFTFRRVSSTEKSSIFLNICSAWIERRSMIYWKNVKIRRSFIS